MNLFIKKELAVTAKVSTLNIGEECIDQYGHVNYKAVPHLLEPAQDALLTDRGTSFDEIEQAHELRSFVKKVEVTWHGELKRDDNCEVHTSLQLGNTSMRFQQGVYVREKLVIELFMVVVLVSSAGEPAVIPLALREQLT